jgi:hypothetical protein
VNPVVYLVVEVMGQQPLLPISLVMIIAGFIDGVRIDDDSSVTYQATAEPTVVGWMMTGNADEADYRDVSANSDIILHYLTLHIRYRADTCLC